MVGSSQAGYFDQQAPVSRVEVVTGTQGPAVLVASGQFDAADHRLAAALGTAVEAGEGRVVLDLTDVDFIDSTVIRAMLQARQEAQRRGGWLRVTWTEAAVGQVIEACGLQDLFSHYPSLAAAVRDRPVVHRPRCW